MYSQDLPPNKAKIVPIVGRQQFVEWLNQT
jgi:hypothetical protein